MSDWRDVAHPIAAFLMWAGLVGLTLYGDRVMHEPVDDDLAWGCPAVLPVVAGVMLGLALTAGWVVKTAWAVAHSPTALSWLRSVG